MLDAFYANNNPKRGKKRMGEHSLQVQELKKYFPVTRGLIFRKVIGYLHAVDGIDFHIKRGETLGLVGESGSGKTTTARLISGLLTPTSGKILFEGENMANMRGKKLKEVKRKIGVVFQDPYSSLDPRKTIGWSITEPLKIHNAIEGSEKHKRTMQLLEQVNLSPIFFNRLPHQLSGGQRQRVAIARALALNPMLIVLDEPVSSLDVSIQAQIINLLKNIQGKFSLAYLFIAHDLSVIRYISDRTAVMYAGKILETAKSKDLFDAPLHPYTEALISAVPIPDPDLMAKKKTFILEGEVPSPINPPSGCRFHPRCKYAMPKCKKVEPEFVNTGKGHYVACHLRS